MAGHSSHLELLRLWKHKNHPPAVRQSVETRHHPLQQVLYFSQLCKNILFSDNNITSADSQYNTAIINTNVIVSYTGEITWLSHGMFKSSCNISVEYFPFDIQDCRLKWASWTFDGYAVRQSLCETEVVSFVMSAGPQPSQHDPGGRHDQLPGERGVQPGVFQFRLQHHEVQLLWGALPWHHLHHQVRHFTTCRVAQITAACSGWEGGQCSMCSTWSFPACWSME